MLSSEIEKQTLCKVQLVRNIDVIWPGYESIMKRVLGTTSIAILKKYSVTPRVRAKSFEVWGRNPGAKKLILNESFNSTLIVPVSLLLIQS